MQKKSGISFLLFACAWIFCAAPATESVAQEEPPARAHFDIPAQPLNSALIAFSKQAGVPISAPTELVAGKMSHALTGEFTHQAALIQMLRSTGLEPARVGVRTYSLARVTPTNRPTKTAETDPVQTETPQASRDQSNPISSRASDATSGSKKKRIAGASRGTEAEGELLEEIVVTGTHIRGVAPTGSSLIVVDRKEIDRTGLATAQEVVRALPQNFRGGASEETTVGREASQNRGYEATGINLRGVGNGATLVLIDGRRLTSGGFEGNLTDVSMIPLSAIERIEVLPDGASAAYGSDAVGGVVNFILRRDYVGAETRLRAGSVTDGGSREYQFSQALGGVLGANTSGLLSYEFYKREALPNSERELAASSDLRPFGGADRSWEFSNPGNLVIGSQRWAIPANQNGQALDASSLIAGAVNLQNALEGRYVLPEQQRHSVFGTVRHEINDRTSIFGDALYTRRDTIWSQGAAGTPVVLSVPATNPFYVNPTGGTEPVSVSYSLLEDFGASKSDFVGKSYNAAAGARVAVGSAWSLDVDATYSLLETDGRSLTPDFAALNAALADPNPATAFNPFGDGSFTNTATIDRIRSDITSTTDSDLLALKLVVEGPLLRPASGAIRLAVGAEQRRESFRSTLLIPASAFDNRTRGDRTVRAAFAELLVPLVGHGNARVGLQQLTLSLADRYEDFSDFGNATTPKFALNWSPIEQLSVRGTWSKSFRAPNLTDLDERNNISRLRQTPNPLSPTGRSAVLIWFPKSADLNAERATVWSAGADFVPVSVPGAKLGVTYFDIAFENRIEDPRSGAFLTDPALAFLVTRNPTTEQRQNVCGRSRFVGNPGDCLGAPIAAIVDFRIRNTAINNISGFDVIGNYAFDTGAGGFDVGLNGTYLRKFDRQASTLVAVQHQLNTASNPVDLRVRGQISWTRSRWGATGYLNYTDSYQDDVDRSRKVSSWTTADLQLAYTVERDAATWLADSTLSLNAQNVFDEEPPFYDNSHDFHGYDGENAGILGRFVSLQIRKSW